MYRVKLVVVALAVLFALVGFWISKESFSRASSAAAENSARPAATPSPSTGGCLQPPAVSSTIPLDLALISQQDANCFAWQEFIALNWTANTATCSASSDPASQFGEPSNTAPVVWETYKEKSEVFLPGAKAPDPWCSQQPMPMNLTGGKVTALKKNSKHGYKALTSISKADDNPQVVLSDFKQAGDDSWLAAQSGYIVMVEVRMNLDEFNYINMNQLYNANVQQTFVQNPGINLPDGTKQSAKYGNIGTIELKAAWLELDDPAQWPYYKTSQAYVVYPWAPKTPKLVTVGLVGLHIIHKTPSQQQFVWATFEHVANAPSTTDLTNKTLLPSYTFYNQNCDPATDYYQCSPNASSAPQGYPACTSSPVVSKGAAKAPAPSASPTPPPCTQAIYQAPVQVLRTTPISSYSTNNIAGINQYAWGQIGKANSDSVFLNYQLVNVLWANGSQKVPAGARVNLTQGDPEPLPQVQPVDNTTLETYLQDVSCILCHTGAPIASPVLNKKPLDAAKQARAGKPLDSPPPYASDYSFLFARAFAPPAKPKPKPKKK